MQTSKRLIVSLVACVGLLGARSGDLAEYKGESLSSEHGLVVLRVQRQQSESSSSSVVTREYRGLMAVIYSVDGKQKFIVGGIDTIRAFVLPAGRWYVAEIRTPKERDLPQITDKQDAKLRSFEVIGGSINYAGVYSVQFVLDADGRQSVNVNIEYAADAVQEAAEAFPDAFAAMPLMYCPLGRKCKPPSEFKF